MSITLIVTNVGRAALVNAANTGTAPVTITQVGFSSTAVVPAKTATTLPGEFKRIAGVGGLVVADDTIHIVATDSSADAFSLRSFALYLADGTLFAIYGQPAPILEKAAASIAAFAMDVIFADIDAAMLTFGNTDFTMPPATTERQGVVELATVAEAQAGIDFLRALTPGTAKAAILGWLLSQDGAGSGLDADLLDGKQGAEFALLTGANFSGGVYAPLLGAANLSGAYGHVVVVPGSATNNGYVSFRDTFGSQTGYIGANAFGAALSLYGTAGVRVVAGPFYVDGSRPATIDAGSGFMALQGDTGGWSLGYTFRGSGGALLGGFGLLGAANAATYYWMGPDYSSADTIRVYPGVGPTYGTNKLWHAANDGAGSGLDADLLDGRQGAEYALSTNAIIVGSLIVGAAGVVGNGSVGMTAGGTGNTGYFTWTSENGVRQGYMGFGGVGADIPMVAEGATGFTTNKNFKVGGTLTRAGNQVWDAGNDGAGSGLDADLLDGRQAAEFALLTGATFSGAVSAPNLAAIGNAGGGAPAIVGGVSGHVGYVTFRDAGGVQQSYIGNQAFGDPMQIACTAGVDFSGGAVRANGSAIWNAGNDGAGSGLDADLLDGRQAAEFALLTGAAFSGRASFVSPNSGTSGGVVIKDGAGNPGLAVLQFTNNAGSSQYGYVGGTAGGGVVFGNNTDEVFRLTSGRKVLFNATADFDTSIGASVLISTGATGIGSALAIKHEAGGQQSLQSFYSGSSFGRVGWIGTDGSITQYNTTSDIRLKWHIVDAAPAGDIIDAIRVREFDYRSTGAHVRFGVIAQELHEVFPEAVTVGSELTNPETGEPLDPWGVDASKLAFLAIKEIQALRQRVAELEAAA